MKRFFYLFLLLFMVFAGCNPKETQEPFRPKIAVRCILKTTQIAKAYIENTAGLLDVSWKDELYDYELGIRQPHYAISNAKVTLLKNGDWVDSLHYNSSTYLYEGSQHSIEQGENYRIEVLVEGLPLVYATCMTPNPVTIEKIDTYTINNGNLPGLGFTITFSDPVKENNFYELIGWNLEYRNPNYIIQPNIILLNSLPLFENSYNNRGFTTLPYFSDKLFDGKTITIKLEDKSGWIGIVLFGSIWQMYPLKKTSLLNRLKNIGTIASMHLPSLPQSIII